ncbi:hypothetical protein BMETH_1316_0 [methanotrophic bacterial endosymbiont of Bathymodiolus sp.]|nr:hypothetical protein BMETH_1316_0 [methanotrophic bacterial endosymbiont of Bathymodiolus sp.]
MLFYLVLSCFILFSDAANPLFMKLHRVKSGHIGG